MILYRKCLLEILGNDAFKGKLVMKLSFLCLLGFYRKVGVGAPLEWSTYNILITKIEGSKC